MDENKTKEGISVKEIENFAKKYKVEVFLGLMVFLASLFSFFSFFGLGWSIVMAGGGAILGMSLSAKVEIFLKKTFQLIFKQEGVLQLVFGVIGVIFSILLPLLIFLFIGLAGGYAIYRQAIDCWLKR